MSLPTSLRTSIREEFKRTPIAASAAVGGIVIATIGLLVAAPGLSTQPGVSRTPANSADANSFILRNFLFVLSFFLAATVASATLVRLLARTRSLGAVLLSIPTAATTSFLTLAIWRMWPPRTLTPETLPDARDLVLYATIIVYVSIAGRAVLRDVSRTTLASNSSGETEASEGETTRALEILFSAGFFLLIWSSATGACLKRLVELFFL